MIVSFLKAYKAWFKANKTFAVATSIAAFLVGAILF